MPTTARTLESTTVSQPAARMRSPPTPKNSSRWFSVARAPSPARRRKASISSAPYISPEASPAEIRIRTESIVTGDAYFDGLTNHVGTAALGCPIDSKSSCGGLEATDQHGFHGLVRGSRTDPWLLSFAVK